MIFTNQSIAHYILVTMTTSHLAFSHYLINNICAFTLTNKPIKGTFDLIDHD